jgi:seryl-tRNA synthetase
MLQINFIRENKEKVIAGMEKKRLANARQLVEESLAVDELRKDTQTQRDAALAESNQMAKEIGALMQSGRKDEAEGARKQTAALKETSKDLSNKLTELENKLTQLLYLLPNMPHEKVPAGKSADDNVVVMQWGELPNLPDDALPHWELIKKYDIIDFELGNKVSGAGFPFYKGKGAKIQRALINFFLNEAEKAGYQEIQAPILINEASGYGTGQLPDKEGQMYQATADNLFLIPTAEVPITNMYRDEIVNMNQLPIKLAGYTPCFRREAGSWGAHVRGLNRLHQFDKVEIVRIERPENSYAAHEEMCAHVEGLFKQLGIPFRKLLLCGGDISFNAALCYDMEVYSGAQKRWLEASSISNFETFQANRLKLRFKDEKGKTQLAHTLNGSALALPRVLAALLENNQTPEGIRVPDVLRPFCGFDFIN